MALVVQIRDVQLAIRSDVACRHVRRCMPAPTNTCFLPTSGIQNGSSPCHNFILLFSFDYFVFYVMTCIYDNICLV